MKKILRKWLKRQIIKAHAMPEQLAYEWIYNSPLSTWRDKLFCMRMYPNRWKEVYSFLSNASNSSSGQSV